MVAYLAGSDVLWRMTHAIVFWEFGKYAIIFLIILLMIREKISFRNNYLLLGYFLCLLPSAALSVLKLGFGAKDAISFNLSGPAVIFICGVYYYRKPLLLEDLKLLMLSFIAPVLSISTICLLGFFGPKEIIFTAESIRAATGGYGPNQVSMILGMGLVFLFFVIGNSKIKSISMILSGVFLWVLSQAVLSFSRGGVLVGIIAVATSFILKLVFEQNSTHLNQKNKNIIWVSAIFCLFIFLILPKLTFLTNDKLKVRYQESTTSGRLNLMYNDAQLAMKNPLLGVGTGMSKYHRGQRHDQVAAHTEFTRMVSEHGIMGFFSALFLFLWSIRNIKKKNFSIIRYFILSLFILGYGSMLHAAMRISAISYLISLTGITVLKKERLTTFFFQIKMRNKSLS